LISNILFKFIYTNANYGSDLKNYNSKSDFVLYLNVGPIGHQRSTIQLLMVYGQFVGSVQKYYNIGTTRIYNLTNYGQKKVHN
jgi:hypothetical protein